MSRANGELPVGWVKAALGEITLDKVAQGAPPADRDFTYVDISSVDNEAKAITNPKRLPGGAAPTRARQHVRLGDVLVSLTRPNLNAVALVPAELDGAIASTGFDVLRTAFVDPKWVFALVRSREFVSSISARVQGALYPAVRPNDVRDYEVPLPPLPEQRRIVAKIEDLQARSRRARERLDILPRLLAQLRQSVLAAAFRGELTADWRARNPDVEPASVLLERIHSERRRHWEETELGKMRAAGREPKDNRWKQKYKEPEPVDTSELPQLPERWAWATVQMLSTKVTDGVHKKPNYLPQGVPFVTVKNLTAGPGISFEDVKFISPEDHREFIKRTHPEQGDVLVSKDGTLGVVRLIETATEFSIFVSVALIKPVLPEFGPYLATALAAPQGQEGMKATGSGLQHIHLVDLRATVVPVPPAAEIPVLLKRAQSLLDAADAVSAKLIDERVRLDDLDRTILSKAFRGELVPQDPNDEPASVLLARIRAEREQEGTRKGRGRGRPRRAVP